MIRSHHLLVVTTLLSAVHATLPVNAAEPNAIVRTIGPEPVSGQLLGFSFNQGVTIRVDGDTRHISADEIVSILISRSGQSSPETAAGITNALTRGEARVELSNGDRIIGRMVEGRSEHFVIQSTLLDKVRVSLDVCDRIIWSAGESAALRSRVNRFLFGGKMEEDAVLTANGDVIRGFITTLDPESIAVDTPNGEVRVPENVAVACRFGKSNPNESPRLRVTISLSSGERVTAVGLDWSDERIEARTLEDERVHFDPRNITRMDVAGGRWIWLCEERKDDLSTASGQSLMNVDWPPMHDRNVRGGTLQVANQTFERGIGVHSQSSLSYALKGKYDELVISFGMDDDSGPLADVTAVISVDGEEKLKRTGVRRGTLFGPFRIDLHNADFMTLQVDYGENGDLQDRFDWIEPGLILRPQAPP